jgi:hypothetical protein
MVHFICPDIDNRRYIVLVGFLSYTCATITTAVIHAESNKTDTPNRTTMITEDHDIILCVINNSITSSQNWNCSLGMRAGWVIRDPTAQCHGYYPNMHFFTSEVRLECYLVSGMTFFYVLIQHDLWRSGETDLEWVGICTARILTCQFHSKSYWHDWPVYF